MAQDKVDRQVGAAMLADEARAIEQLSGVLTPEMGKMLGKLSVATGLPLVEAYEMAGSIYEDMDIDTRRMYEGMSSEAQNVLIERNFKRKVLEADRLGQVQAGSQLRLYEAQGWLPEGTADGFLVTAGSASGTGKWQSASQQLYKEARANGKDIRNQADATEYMKLATQAGYSVDEYDDVATAIGTGNLSIKGALIALQEGIKDPTLIAAIDEILARSRQPAQPQAPDPNAGGGQPQAGAGAGQPQAGGGQPSGIAPEITPELQDHLDGTTLPTGTRSRHLSRIQEGKLGGPVKDWAQSQVEQIRSSYGWVGDGSGADEAAEWDAQMAVLEVLSRHVPDQESTTWTTAAQKSLGW